MRLLDDVDMIRISETLSWFQQAAATLATSRRKIDVCSIVVNRAGQRKPRRGERRGI